MPIENNKSLKDLLKNASTSDLKIIASAISPNINGGNPSSIMNLWTTANIELAGGIGTGPGKTVQVPNKKLAETLAKLGLAQLDSNGNITSIHGELGVLKEVVVPGGRGDTAGGKSLIITPVNGTLAGGDTSGTDSLETIRSTAISKISNENYKKFEDKKRKGLADGSMMWRISEKKQPDGSIIRVPVLVERDPEATEEKRKAALDEANKTGKDYSVPDEYKLVNPPSILEEDTVPANRDDQTIAIMHQLNPGKSENEIKNAPSSSLGTMALSGLDFLSGIYSSPSYGPTARKLNAITAKIAGLVKAYTSDGNKLHDIAAQTKDFTGAYRQATNYGNAAAGALEVIAGFQTAADDKTEEGARKAAEQITEGEAKIAENFTKEFVVVNGTGLIGDGVARIVVGTEPNDLSSSQARRTQLVPSEMTIDEWERLKQSAPKSTSGIQPKVNARGNKIILDNQQQKNITNEIIKNEQKVGFNRTKSITEFIIYFVIYGLPLLGFTEENKIEEEEKIRLTNEARQKGCMEGPYVQSGGTTCLPIKGPVEVYDENTGEIKEIPGIPEVLIGPGADLNELPGLVPMWGTQPPLDIFVAPPEEMPWWKKILYGLSEFAENTIHKIANLGLNIKEDVVFDVQYVINLLTGGDNTSLIQFKLERFILRRRFQQGEIKEKELEEGLIDINKREIEFNRKKIDNKQSSLFNPKEDPNLGSNTNLALEISEAQYQFDKSKKQLDGLIDIAANYNVGFSNTPNVALNQINQDTTFVTNVSDVFIPSEFTPVVTPANIADSGCFTSETLIKCPSVDIKISELKVGDSVISFDSFGNLHEDVVSNIFFHSDKNISKFIFENGIILEATDCHPVLTINNTFVEIGKLSLGDVVINSENNPIKIIKIEHDFKIENVFNIEVLNNHTYIANNIRVHNKLGAAYTPDYTNDVRNLLIKFTEEEQKYQDEYMMWMCEQFPENCDYRKDRYPIKTPPDSIWQGGNSGWFDDKNGDYGNPGTTEVNREAIITTGPYRGVIGNSNYIWSPGEDSYQNSRIGFIGPPVPPELRRRK